MPTKIKSKKSSKVKKKTKGSSNKEQAYYDSLDFRSLWESFSMDTDPANGLLKYTTVWQFVRKQTSVHWQREMLYWILGPAVKDNPASPYKQFDQLDFLTRRTNGHWYAPSNIEQLGKSLKSKQSAFEKLNALGDVTVDLISDIKQTLFQINQAFAGGIMLAGLSAKENMMRSKLYMSLKQDLLNQMQQAQTMFAATQGVDLNQLNQFLSMFAGGMGQAAGLGASLGIIQTDNESSAKSGMKSVASMLIDMVADKGFNYGMELPDPEMAAIVKDSAKPTLVKTK